MRGEVEDAPWLWLHLVPGVGLANQQTEQGTDVSIRLQYLKKKKKKATTTRLWARIMVNIGTILAFFAFICKLALFYFELHMDQNLYRS